MMMKKINWNLRELGKGYLGMEKRRRRLVEGGGDGSAAAETSKEAQVGSV